jgi:hypothetical protein
VEIAVSDAQTFNIIKNGVADTPMTPQRLPESDIWRIVTYIHPLRGPAVPGLSRAQGPGRRLRRQR